MKTIYFHGDCSSAMLAGAQPSSGHLSTPSQGAQPTLSLKPSVKGQTQEWWSVRLNSSHPPGPAHGLSGLCHALPTLESRKQVLLVLQVPAQPPPSPEASSFPQDRPATYLPLPILFWKSLPQRAPGIHLLASRICEFLKCCVEFHIWAPVCFYLRRKQRIALSGS